ncbi:hypothetical protein A2U01_0087816, partial [Trifolium medium]|nr:hypothetical protein [Trifolium medium]
MDGPNKAEDVPSSKPWGVPESPSHTRGSTPTASAGSTDSNSTDLESEANEMKD